MLIYSDESGDLGWKFDHPFRAGGSSRFLTLSFLIIPTQHRTKPIDILRGFYKDFGWKGEKKASKSTHNQKIRMCNEALEMLKTHTDIKIDVITVKKLSVQSHFRSDSNKLYNYMIGLVVPEHVKSLAAFDLITDERSIKVKDQNVLEDYLQTKLKVKIGCPTIIQHKHLAIAGHPPL